MKNILITATFISLLLLVSSASASLTITASSTSSTMTTGTSVTVTTQFQADSNGGSGSFYLTCTPSTGYTVSEGSQSVNLGASASDTKYYTFTPSVSGTYSDCKVTDGQTSSGTMTFSVVNPSTISVDGQIGGVSNTSITKNGGDSFTLTVYVGPASSATTSSYSLSVGSSLSASGNDPTSGTMTIPASGSTSKSWTITLASGFTSGTSSVTFQLGSNSNAYSLTVTGAGAGGTTTTTDGGTVGGGVSEAAKIKVTTTRGKATITVPSIAAGKMANVTINKTEDMSITIIEITVKNSVNNIQVVITKLDGKPISIIHNLTGKVYHYIEITKTNITDTDINKTKIKFKVEKSWINSGNINESTISLQRYDNQWNKLTTTKVSEDTTDIYFEAESPGLSVFAISGEEKIAVAPSVEERPEEKVGGAVGEAIKKVPIWLYVIFILAISLAALFFFKYKGKITKNLEKI